MNTWFKLQFLLKNILQKKKKQKKTEQEKIEQYKRCFDFFKNYVKSFFKSQDYIVLHVFENSVEAYIFRIFHKKCIKNIDFEFTQGKNNKYFDLFLKQNKQAFFSIILYHGVLDVYSLELPKLSSRDTISYIKNYISAHFPFELWIFFEYSLLDLYIKKLFKPLLKIKDNNVFYYYIFHQSRFLKYIVQVLQTKNVYKIEFFYQKWIKEQKNQPDRNVAVFLDKNIWSLLVYRDRNIILYRFGNYIDLEKLGHEITETMRYLIFSNQEYTLKTSLTLYNVSDRIFDYIEKENFKSFNSKLSHLQDLKQNKRFWVRSFSFLNQRILDFRISRKLFISSKILFFGSISLVFCSFFCFLYILMSSFEQKPTMSKEFDEKFLKHIQSFNEFKAYEDKIKILNSLEFFKSAPVFGLFATEIHYDFLSSNPLKNVLTLHFRETKKNSNIQNIKWFHHVLKGTFFDFFSKTSALNVSVDLQEIKISILF
jgi:hypothetical protein